MVRCGIFAASIWNERFNLLMFTLLCAISIQDLKIYCKDRRLLLYMSRTLHLFGTDWCAMMVPIQALQWYRFTYTIMLPTNSFQSTHPRGVRPSLSAVVMMARCFISKTPASWRKVRGNNEEKVLRFFKNGTPKAVKEWTVMSVGDIEWRNGHSRFVLVVHYNTNLW